MPDVHTGKITLIFFKFSMQVIRSPVVKKYYNKPILLCGPGGSIARNSEQLFCVHEWLRCSPAVCTQTWT